MHVLTRHATLPYVTESENTRRLGLEIRDRQDFLGLSARELGDRVGLAAGSIYAIERGRPPRRSSRVALERELYWETGSCDLILAGGNPVVLPEPTARSIEVSPGERLVLDEMHRLPEVDQKRLQRQFLAQIRTWLDEQSL